MRGVAVSALTRAGWARAFAGMLVCAFTGKAPVSSTHPENPRVPPGGGMWLNVGFMPFPPTHTPDLDSDLEAKEICRSM